MALKELDKEIRKFLQQVGQLLLHQARQVKDDQLMEQEKGRYQRDKRKPPYLLTRFD